MYMHLIKSAAFSSLIVAAILLTFASPAIAQRDAGSKARGDSTPFFGSPRNQSRSFSPMVVESQRRFSYEPTPFQVGERVEVSTPEAKVMKGTQTVGTIKQGQIVEVRKIEGPWLGIEVHSNGKKLSGWIWNQYVTPVREPSTVSPELAPAQPQVQRRSFSYEPAPQINRGSGSTKKEPWQYQKTDPRRYRH